MWSRKKKNRWFKVTFWSPSWRSLSHLKGSLNHSKKGTSRIARNVCFRSKNATSPQVFASTWVSRSFSLAWRICEGVVAATVEDLHFWHYNHLSTQPPTKNIYIYIPGTQMTLVLIEKDLVLGGWPSKIEVIWVPGIYTYGIIHVKSAKLKSIPKRWMKKKQLLLLILYKTLQLTVRPWKMVANEWRSGFLSRNAYFQGANC